MLEWAKAHDAEAQAIAQKSSQFAESYLSEEGIYQYLCLLLTEYQKIYHDHVSYIDLQLYTLSSGRQ